MIPRRSWPEWFRLRAMRRRYAHLISAPPYRGYTEQWAPNVMRRDPTPAPEASALPYIAAQTAYTRDGWHLTPAEYTVLVQGHWPEGGAWGSSDACFRTREQALVDAQELADAFGAANPNVRAYVAAPPETH